MLKYSSKFQELLQALKTYWTQKYISQLLEQNFPAGKGLSHSAAVGRSIHSFIHSNPFHLELQTSNWSQVLSHNRQETRIESIPRHLRRTNFIKRHKNKAAFYKHSSLEYVIKKVKRRIALTITSWLGRSGFFSTCHLREERGRSEAESPVDIVAQGARIIPWPFVVTTKVKRSLNQHILPAFSFLFLFHPRLLS